MTDNATGNAYLFLKPKTTRAAREYGFDFQYNSRPARKTNENLLKFAKTIRNDRSDLRPQDFIDI